MESGPTRRSLGRSPPVAGIDAPTGPIVPFGGQKSVVMGSDKE
jgi:hypothetical protein